LKVLVPGPVSQESQTADLDLTKGMKT
jgi:hypothetical protein